MAKFLHLLLLGFVHAGAPASRYSSTPPVRDNRIHARDDRQQALRVQMLLVAFSRRMCCSRVCNVSRSAGLPCVL